MIDDSKLSRFIAFRDAMKKVLPWWSDGRLRDAAAIHAMKLEGEPAEVIAQLRPVAKILKKNASGLTILRKETRYILAAELLLRDRDAGSFTNEMKAAKRDWKKAKLKNDPTSTGSALALMLMSSKASADSHDLATLKTAYESLKKKHRWSTDPAIIPLLAIGLQFNPDAEGFADAMVPKIRSQLSGLLVMPEAVISSILDKAPDEIIAKMDAIETALKERKFKRATPNTPSIAIATLIDIRPDQLADEVMQAIAVIAKGRRINLWDYHHTALNIVICEHLKATKAPQAKIAPLVLSVITFFDVMKSGDGGGGGGP